MHCTAAQPFKFIVCLSRRFSLMRVLFSSSRRRLRCGYREMLNACYAVTLVLALNFLDLSKACSVGVDVACARRDAAFVTLREILKV